MDLSALMQSVQEGDRESLAKLCSLYQNELYNTVIQRTDNADEARSVVKEVFKEMYRTIREKGPQTGDFSAWLHQLADKELRARWHDRVQSALEKTAMMDANQDKEERAFSVPKIPGGPVIVPDPARGYTEQPPSLAPKKQYTPDEARELEARVDARLSLDDFDDEDDYEDEEKGGMLSLTALIGLSALLMWILVGFLSSLGILPEIDLGYSWFNETLFRLF